MSSTQKNKKPEKSSKYKEKNGSKNNSNKNTMKDVRTIFLPQQYFFHSFNILTLLLMLCEKENASLW